MTVSDTGAWIRVDSKCRVHGCRGKHRSGSRRHVQLVPAEVKDFDDICIILIQFFGGYLISEMLHAKVARHMHGVSLRMQRLQGECMELHVTCKEIPFLLRGSVEVCNNK